MLIKSIRQSTPADILRQHFLFFRDCRPALRFNLFQCSDSLRIPVEFLLSTAFPQMIIRDQIVLCLCSCLFCQSRFLCIIGLPESPGQAAREALIFHKRILNPLKILQALRSFDLQLIASDPHF